MVSDALACRETLLNYRPPLHGGNQSKFDLGLADVAREGRLSRLGHPELIAEVKEMTIGRS